jgi:hypothetical protein
MYASSVKGCLFRQLYPVKKADFFRFFALKNRGFDRIRWVDAIRDKIASLLERFPHCKWVINSVPYGD